MPVPIVVYGVIAGGSAIVGVIAGDFWDPFESDDEAPKAPPPPPAQPQGETAASCYITAPYGTNYLSDKKCKPCPEGQRTVNGTACTSEPSIPSIPGYDGSAKYYDDVYNAFNNYCTELNAWDPSRFCDGNDFPVFGPAASMSSEAFEVLTYGVSPSTFNGHDLTGIEFDMTGSVGSPAYAGRSTYVRTGGRLNLNSAQSVYLAEWFDTPVGFGTTFAITPRHREIRYELLDAMAPFNFPVKWASESFDQTQKNAMADAIVKFVQRDQIPICSTEDPVDPIVNNQQALLMALIAIGADPTANTTPWEAVYQANNEEFNFLGWNASPIELEHAWMMDLTFVGAKASVNMDTAATELAALQQRIDSRELKVEEREIDGVKVKFLVRGTKGNKGEDIPQTGIAATDYLSIRIGEAVTDPAMTAMRNAYAHAQRIASQYDVPAIYILNGDGTIAMETNGRPKINMDVARCIMTLTEDQLMTDPDADAGTRVAWMMLQMEGMRGDGLSATGGSGGGGRPCDHDGQIDPPEICDDGNMNNNDACKNNCTPNVEPPPVENCPSWHPSGYWETHQAEYQLYLRCH